MTAGGVALDLRGIHKRFGDTIALDGASLSVASGTLHALLGETGAGKTTLLNVAAGLTRPDGGALTINAQPMRGDTPADARSAGLSAVHQHFSLVAAMTVAENVALSSPGLFRKFSASDAAERVRAIATAAGFRVDPSALVANLPVAAQQRVEIIKALANDPAVLMLDEPTAALSPSEAAELFVWLRAFVDRGRTAVVITHRIREAMKNADAVTVLRSGRTVMTAAVRDTDEASVLTAILGEAPIRVHGTPTRNPGSAAAMTPVLVLRNSTVIDAGGVTRLSPLSLAVHAGEVLGVAGIDGGAQHELLRVLAGRRRPDSVTAELPTTIGFVPEDRLHDSIIPELSLVETLALRGAGKRHGKINWSDLTNATRQAIRGFGVQTRDEYAPASSLSGGNQQRFVLARELADSPAAFIAENPTRGLDVRAASDVLERIRSARDRGAAVVVYSSDLDELLSIADRIVVCFGSSVHETPLDAAVIGRAMVGAQ